MKRLLLSLLLMLGAIGQPVLAVSPLMHNPSYHRQPGAKHGTSTNWSGYAALTNLTNPQIGAVSDVKGGWTVPAVSCTATTAYSSAWVGIDGYSSSTVEQIGTDADCSSGRPVYYAWYEMYPHWPVNLSLAVRPGDHISAEVKYTGSSRFQLMITNDATGRSYSVTQRLSNARRSSAEWVQEAPSSNSGVLPLANFGQIGFDKATAALNGTSGSISNPAWANDPLTMVTASGAVKAQPSALSGGGTAFSVTWQHQ